MPKPLALVSEFFAMFLTGVLGLLGVSALLVVAMGDFLDRLIEAVRRA